MKILYCGKCHKALKSKHFHKNKSTKSGYETTCKECRNEYYRIRYERLKASV